MLKRRGIAPILLGALVTLTGIFAAAHLTTRAAAPEHALVICAGGAETVLDMDAVEWEEVRGETVNGRGEVNAIEAPGLPLGELLAAAGIDPESVAEVRAIASDAYSATMTGEEVRAEGTVCLIRRDDGSCQMVVFGDPNSRRNVRDVERLEAELLSDGDAAREGGPAAHAVAGAAGG